MSETITKTENRKLVASRDGDGLILAEKVAYQPMYQLRRKWSDDRVYISLAELRKLAEKYL